MLPTNNYFFLASLWITWCTLHSILASDSFNEYVLLKTGKKANYLRLIYNAFAGVSIIPVVLYGRQFESQILFQFSGSWIALQVFLVGFALFFFRGGARAYDLQYFLGFKQLKKGYDAAVMPPLLSTKGTLQLTRHPWYTGGILIIWSYESNLTIAGIIANTIITGYFVVGAILEEKKLVKKFGPQYIKYQHDVSMLIPLKWIKLKLKTDK